MEISQFNPAPRIFQVQLGLVYRDYSTGFKALHRKGK